MATSRTDIIKEYLEKNPNATGKEAEAALRKHGINAQYFYTIKSSLSHRRKRGGRKKAGRKVVRKKVRIGSPVLSVEELQTVATFAAEFGGLDKLNAAITALRQFQVD